MPTIQQQLNQLKRDKATLNTMLNTMGVETTGKETFTELTPLVGKIVTDPILQDKSITIIENGTTNIVPDSGYNGLNNVEVITNIPSEKPILQDKSIEITENGTTTIKADSGYNGLNEVTVTTNIVGSGSTEMPSIKQCKFLFYEGARINETETVISMCTGATSMANMFKGAGNSLTSVTGFANFKNNNSVSTESMFYGVTYITSIDFTPNTRIVSTKTSSMFNGCSRLPKLDLSGFDFSAVTNTYGMFNNCKLLEELDISSWDFSKVTNFRTMFTNCGANLTDGKLTKVYVKDATAQSWILNSANGRPDTWSTANVIIK